jgi:gliding motility-associated-like protein
MDISYACYGNDLYQFYVTFYRDCIGIAAPPSMKMYLGSDNCAYLDSFSMNLVYSTQGSDTISHLAGLCPDAVSQCAGGTYTGYEQYIYAVNVTLPMICDDWTASTYVEFRNNAITNLQNPGQQRLYVECHFSNADGLCDNSPLFSNVPLAYSCVHEPFLYNHGAYDPDGDSLVYTLVNPLNGANDPIDYVSLFLGPEYPLYTENDTFGFDPLTGQMSCVPDAVQIVVISVLIDEYRYGAKIGSTQRDLQVVIKTCINNLPGIPDGVQNLVGGVLLDSNTIQVCPGSLIDFDLTGVDIDAGDTLSMSTNLPFVIPEATFTFAGENPDTMHVQWQTAIADTGFYVFTVTVKDDACPISGSQIYSFTIQIGTPEADAGPDVRICETNPEVQLSVTGLPPFLWSNAQYLNNPNAQNPVATLPGLGIYQFVVTADIGGFCQRNDTVYITVDPDFSSSTSIFPDTVCAGQQVTLLATASGGVGDFSYEWSSVPLGYSDTSASAVDSPVVTTTYVALITSGGCSHYDSATVIVNPLPGAQFFADTSACAGVPADFNYSGGDTTGLDFSWSFAGGTIQSGSGAGPYQVIWNNAGVYAVSLMVTDELGCSSISSKLVTVHALPTAEFAAIRVGCEPLTVEFQNQSTGGLAYAWDFGDGNTSAEINPTHTYTAGSYSVSLTVTSAFGCTDTEVKNDFIQVLPVPVACGTTQEDLSHPYDLTQSTFHFENCSEGASDYVWDFGDGFISDEENPVHTYTNLDTFFVTLIASNGYCADTALIGPIEIVLINQVYFPLAFSPNNDGHNDFFHELGGIGVTDLYYAVYNRWGELIYESDDLQSTGWDGTYKGKECDVGVYVWRADAGFVNGSRTSVSGNVTLIR